MRKNFENEIKALKDQVLLLGSMVEQGILNSVAALKARDLEASQSIYELDSQINARRFAIEEQVMVVIATQQPAAHDLRLLASMLEVAGELERMGDYAKGIATVNLRLGNQPLLKPLVDVPLMARKCVDMLHRSLTAFINEDVQAARLIPGEDDEVDALYSQVYRELMTFVMADAKSIEPANWLLWVAHNLERVADRVTNICERTIFTATGEMKEIKASDDEQRSSAH